ncbi:MAG: acyltransferase [bacterium]|nr:acyltransferase [bacterium]
MSFATELWHQAAHVAHATPDTRNRYVDFLRAASITVVILGHWLVAAPYLPDAGALVAGNMLEIAPWTRWLTLAVQVMPIFFLVGGYANHTAWTAAVERGTPYPRWLAGRFQRLIAPVIPVLLAWVAIAGIAPFAGADPALMGLLSQAALVPTWFLAVYVMVGVLVPITYRAWIRYGFRSFWALVAGATLTDVVSFSTGHRTLGLVNYFFVWLAIHQLGYAWREGRFEKRLAWFAGGALATALLVTFGPYPLAMVGFPGMEVSNTSPPTLALLTLGIAQSGLVLAAEPYARRVLDHAKVWTTTVLVNGLIMSVYLWHMTAMIAVYAGLYLAGTGLDLLPNSADWWTSRPLYLLAFTLFLFPLALLVQRFEKPVADLVTYSRRRLVAAATLVCAGLAMISAQGVASGDGLRILPNLLPFYGAGLAGIGPLKILATMGLSGTEKNAD